MAVIMYICMESKEVNEKLVNELVEKKSKLNIEVCISAEADEQWGFVQNKKNQQWLWYIIEKNTRKVLAFTFGRRTDKTYRELVSKLPKNLIDRLYTDDWKSYRKVELAQFHSTSKSETQRIERKNLDIRTRIKRLTRKSICFSKSKLMHHIVIGLFICTYFF